MDQENTEEKGAEFSQRRRSIRDVTLDEELRGEKARFQRSLRNGDEERAPRRHKRGTRYAGYVIGGFVALVIIFGGFLTTSYFSRAIITLVPRSEQVAVNQEIVVSEDSGSGIALTYEIFNIDGQVSETLKSSGEEEVENKATGRIRIYNSYSSDSQALVTSTRFESEDGNIYRISGSVSVPGVRSNGDAGSTVVTVTSDEPGEEFNLSQGRFTIPGLEGTELYDAMYAEIEEPITGGFVGVLETVDAEDEEDARERNREELMRTLESQIAEKLPQEYIFVEGSSAFEFSEQPQSARDGEVVITTSGTLYGVMFKQDLLASFLANEYVTNYDNQRVAVANPSMLSFEIEGAEDLSFSEIQEGLEMVISGDAHIVWVIDTDAAKTALAGTAKSDFQANASRIPGIRGASLDLIPGFMRSIPTNLEKIEVLLEEEL